ncbi:unnamed protein product [Nippostrongylus brasiliensis]|uniref:Tyrosine-protein phosphatase domain-containing protein n=1 Tax=Nippostrongylus brasiliensis TaxID=27835 RepID=A0A0N4XS72_NIPBR|nr:unnamed protein product [Nippostrongylus brasiliensis]
MFQAPLPKTCPDFWYMVVQEKSVSILMLCNFIEQNAKKCAEYIPLEEDKPAVFDGGVTVALKKEEPFTFPFETRVRILVRSLEVSVPGEPVHNCMHYHWQDWPDRGVPEADLAPIVLLSRLKENTYVVHFFKFSLNFSYVSTSHSVACRPPNELMNSKKHI